MMKRDSVFKVVVNALCLLVQLGIAMFLFIYWKNIPELVPGHYNGAGEIDRWTSKTELFFTPVISWLLFLMMTAVEQFPQIWNTGITVTPQNAAMVYQTIGRMLAVMKLWLVLLFGYITINTALSLPLSAWFFPFTMIFVFGTITLSFLKLLKIRKQTKQA